MRMKQLTIKVFTSPPCNPPRVVITSSTLAGVPTSTCTASLCIFANSFCKPLDPATPAANAARTPSGPPTFRITAIQYEFSLRTPGLTFMGLGCLVHCCSDYDNTRSSVGVGLRCGHCLVDSWNHAFRQISSPNQVDDSLGNNPFLSRWSLSNEIRPFQHEG